MPGGKFGFALFFRAEKSKTKTFSRDWFIKVVLPDPPLGALHPDGQSCSLTVGLLQKNQSQLCIPRKPPKIGVWVLSGPLRLRLQSRSRTRLRIAASIAFSFRACFKGL